MNMEAVLHGCDEADRPIAMPVTEVRAGVLVAMVADPDAELGRAVAGQLTLIDTRHRTKLRIASTRASGRSNGMKCPQ